MNKQHEVESVQFDNDWLILSVDGRAYRLPIAQASERLANARERDRTIYQIASSGYGIHWPTLDEDLSINGLLTLATVDSHAS